MKHSENSRFPDSSTVSAVKSGFFISDLSSSIIWAPAAAAFPSCTQFSESSLGISPILAALFGFNDEPKPPAIYSFFGFESLLPHRISIPAATAAFAV